MTPVILIISIILLILAVILTVVVLFQQGKSAGVPGVMGGAADTFFGKNKGKTMDSMFSKLTGALAVIFIVLVLALNVIITNQQKKINEENMQADLENIANQTITVAPTDAPAFDLGDIDLGDLDLGDIDADAVTAE